MSHRVRSLLKAALLFPLALLTACNAPKGTLFYGSLGRGEHVVLVASGVAGAPMTVTAYGINGTFIEVLIDSTYDALVPRGLAKYDAFRFVVAFDGGSDLLGLASTTGGYSQFVTNSNLTGNIFQLAYHESSQNYFVVETNTIEAFSISSSRVGNPAINTTVGSCVLNTPRGLFVDQTNNRMVATNTGGTDPVLVYDLATPASPTCVRSVTTLGAQDPVPVIIHSASNLMFVGTQGNDRISSLAADGTGTATVVYNDTTVVNNPTAMVELPDGSVLVASDGTDQIDRFTVNASTGVFTRVGTTPFIKDGFTLSVNEMLVLRGQ